MNTGIPYFHCQIANQPVDIPSIRFFIENVNRLVSNLEKSNVGQNMLETRENGGELILFVLRRESVEPLRKLGQNAIDILWLGM